jgi:hypothetical protein
MTIPDHTILRIKAATRDVIEACGGLKRSAAIAKVSDSQLSRCSTASGGDVISIMAALALEADCGLHLITAAMASVHGRTLSDPEAAGEPAASVISRGAELVTAAAAAMAAAGDAARDGRITPAEYEAIDREFANVERQVATARKDFAAGKAGAPLRVVGG